MIAVLLAVNFVRSRESPTGPGGLQPLPEPTAKHEIVEKGKDYEVEPVSAPLTQGVRYRYNTGHCGLDFMTDFDGSFWIPHAPEGKVPDFFINETEGTLVVLSHERALFRAPDGGSALLTRHEGPLVLKGLCR